MLPLLAVLIGAGLIPLLAWRIVGERRKHDPFLLPLLIVATGATVGGLADVVIAGGWYDWKLLLGVLGLVTAAVRWRAAGAVREPAV